jgi:teichoic acid transport system ATP-binding protein
MQHSEISIRVDTVTKIYRLYDRHIDRLKESFHPLRRKYHRDFYALDAVSFEVKKGETVGIIGRNGSGKSTLLKIITGVLTPTSGGVIVNGTIAALLELAAGFNPELTGIDNIYLNGTIMGFSKQQIKAKLDDILSFADIGDFANQPIKTYSSGMLVRLAFAVAVNVDPDILIVDEALAVGDINFQAKCYKKFSSFQEQGKTILFVTHSLDSIIRYCHRAIVLEQGKKITETLPKEAVDIYKKLMVGCYFPGLQDGPEKHATGESDDSTNPSIIEHPQDGKINYFDHKKAQPLSCKYNKSSNQTFKQYFSLNDDAVIYGDQRAEIIDFGIFDENYQPVQKLIHGEIFSVMMKVKFKEHIDHPIFAFTVKDIKGLEITGTNTDYKKMPVGVICRGDTVLVEFLQPLNMQAGQYALCLGCTNYEQDQFVVYHRLYDILLFEVLSEKVFVGFYDLDSEIKVELVRR